MARRAKRNRGPVSPKSARGNGRSRDPYAGVGSTANYAVFGETPICGYVEGKETPVARKRKRTTKAGKAGSVYVVFLKPKDAKKCQNEAVVTSPEKRCAYHIGK